MNLEIFLPSLQIEKKQGSNKIFDPVRRLWVTLTPEEMVRQAAIHYLIHEKGYSPRLMNVEKAILYNTLTKRYDLAVYNNKGEAVLLVECKSPDIILDKSVAEQASLYNQSLFVKYIWITNGHTHLIFKTDATSGSTVRVQELPTNTV